jgi:hypothetical protein
MPKLVAEQQPEIPRQACIQRQELQAHQVLVRVLPKSVSREPPHQAVREARLLKLDSGKLQHHLVLEVRLLRWELSEQHQTQQHLVTLHKLVLQE